MNKKLINYINKYKTDTIPNNFSVQIFDKKTDNKLDTLYINNIIKIIYITQYYKNYENYENYKIKYKRNKINK